MRKRHVTRTGPTRATTILPTRRIVNPMIPRMRTIAIVAATVGGPYVATETEVGRSAVSGISDVVGTVSNGDNPLASTTDASVDSSAYATHALHEVEGIRSQAPERYRYDPQLARKLEGRSEGAGAQPTLAGVRVTDLREVLRFDVTPDWVIQRFSRVSTVLSDLRLEGMRVPIVTGTKADDLAGTLTYYFDRSQRLQRVTIHGFTGDPTRLVQAMTEHYGLKNEPTLEAGVYTRRWNGFPVHFVRLSHAPVIHTNAVHQKYTVFVELNQPNLAYGISQEAQKIVQFDRMTGRW